MGTNRVTPEQRRLYRMIGGRLALYVRQQQAGFASVSALQAVAADLAADQSQLVLPLRELVSRPGFRALAPRAGSGSGALECQALLQTLDATFTPMLIAALGEVLAGFLDLPSPAKAVAESSPSATASPEPARDREGDGWGKASAPPPRPSAAPPPASPEALASNRSGPAPSRARTPGLLLLAVATAIAAATGVVVSTRPPLCTALGLCAVQEQGRASQEVLDAAAAAEQALRRAQNLADYRQASEQLEQALLKLSGDNLAPEQQRQRDQLQTTATQARGILQEEEADLSRLDTASQAIAAARTATEPERTQQLAAARQALEGIPPRSFSAAEAERLLDQLTALQQEPQPAAAAAPEPAGSQPEQPRSSVLPAAPSPFPRPPAAQSPRAPRAEPPERDQPLF